MRTFAGGRASTLIATIAHATALPGDDPAQIALAIDAAERARNEPNADELRRRLRGVVRELVANPMLRAALVRIVNRAPASALYKMRNRMRDLIG